MTTYLIRYDWLRHFPLRRDCSGQRRKDLHPKVCKDLLLGLDKGVAGAGGGQVLLALLDTAACRGCSLAKPCGATHVAQGRPGSALAAC